MNFESYSLFSNQLKDVVNKYPNLTIKNENDRDYLKGIIDIPNDNNIIIGSFSIEIRYVEGFPYRFPKLFEIGGDIPIDIDWHKYSDSSCCITVLPDEILQCKNGISVQQFIKSQVVPHLANQLHRKKFGKYKNGEFAHGINGIRQFYSGLMKTSDYNRWIEYFEITFKSKNIRCERNELCFCGSKVKFKKCHAKVFEKLYSIGSNQVLNDFKMIIK